MNRSRSIVEYFGLGDGHRCGYCGNADTNVSHGIDFLVCDCRHRYLWPAGPGPGHDVFLSQNVVDLLQVYSEIYQH